MLLEVLVVMVLLRVVVGVWCVVGVVVLVGCLGEAVFVVLGGFGLLFVVCFALFGFFWCFCLFGGFLGSPRYPPRVVCCGGAAI
ncbi:hypothetical protein RA263_28090, partial [Pseudomonas syringae pv. tagetis]|uniref:hypothetical protein n=1 Tax=Pseudomonas syringae group genomosp. 7 TaxID=251699 RepID=UPI0037705B5C